MVPIFEVGKVFDSYRKSSVLHEGRKKKWIFGVSFCKGLRFSSPFLGCFLSFCKVWQGFIIFITFEVLKLVGLGIITACDNKWGMPYKSRFWKLPIGVTPWKVHSSYFLSSNIWHIHGKKITTMGHMGIQCKSVRTKYSKQAQHYCQRNTKMNLACYILTLR